MLGGARDLAVQAPGGVVPSAFTQTEIERLCPGFTVSFGDAAALDADITILRGEDLPGEAAIRTALAQRAAPPPPCTPAEAERLLAAAEKAAIRATSKPGDGIVSRTLNRPVSQAITALLLRWFPAIQPIQATWGTVVLGALMFTCLLSGTAAGLMIGAVLFHAASVFDGVDGEIARAAWRASPEGARIDSLVDAATNLGFIAGVTLNLWLQGERFAAQAGAAGLALFGLGLWLIGRRNRSTDGSLTFNAVKEHLARNPSKIRQWLTWLTMRDFFALAGAVFILSGFAAAGLVAFAVVAAGWFMVVVVVTARHAA